MDIARATHGLWTSLGTLATKQGERRRSDRRFAAHERRLTAGAARPTLITLTAASLLSLAVDAGPQGIPVLVGAFTTLNVALGLVGLVILPQLHRRHQGAVVFAAMLLALQGPILTMSEVAALVVSTYAYLMIIPMGIAVFVPWSTRLHGLWLVGYGITVIELVVLLSRRTDWALGVSDVLGPLIVVGVVSLAGHIVARQRRRESFDRLLESMGLRRQVRQENVRIQTMSDRSAADARTDALTGIANRFALEEDLTVEAATSAVTGSVLMIDIDHFKRLNDRFGHAAGDAALTRVAAAIGGALRTHDRVYRYGGEEFTVRLDGTGAQTAQGVADRIRRAVRILAIPNPGSTTGEIVTISIGIAALDRLNPIGAIRRADQAMYAAKRAGRDRAVTWSAEVTAAQPA